MMRVASNTSRPKSAAANSSASRPPLRSVVALRPFPDRMIALMLTHPTIVGTVMTKFAPSGLTIVSPADKIRPKATSAALLKSQGRNQTV